MPNFIAAQKLCKYLVFVKIQQTKKNHGNNNSLMRYDIVIKICTLKLCYFYAETKPTNTITNIKKKIEGY